MNASDQIETEIRIKLLPRSSRNQILGLEHDTFRVKVTAPPVDGKANKTLIEFLAKRLGVSKGSVKIVSGKTGRLKRVLIHGLTFEDIEKRLKA